MDHSITRRDRLQQKWRALAATGMQTMARPPQAPAGRFAHFATPEQEQAHAQHVEQHQGSAPF